MGPSSPAAAPAPPSPRAAPAPPLPVRTGARGAQPSRCRPACAPPRATRPSPTPYLRARRSTARSAANTHPQRRRLVGVEGAPVAHNGVHREAARRVEAGIEPLDALHPIEPEDPDPLGALAVRHRVPHLLGEDQPVGADDPGGGLLIATLPVAEATLRRALNASRSALRCSRLPAVDSEASRRSPAISSSGTPAITCASRARAESITDRSSISRSSAPIMASPSSSASSSPRVSRIGRRKWLVVARIWSASM